MNDKNTMGEGDGVLAALLAASGARPVPSEIHARQVRAAVEAEWRSLVDVRQRRRRMTTWAAAAAVATVAVSAWLVRPLSTPAEEPFATLARAEGTVEYREGDAGAWRHLGAGARLAPGAELRTGEAGRVALELDSGVVLRLDHRSRLDLATPSRATLAAGAVYVDVGAGGTSHALDFGLATSFGEVRHLGTQYEARLLDGALRVAVREGRVGVGPADAQQVAEAGEQLLFAAGGVQRSAVAPHDSQWDWIGTVTPPFAIEGRSVDEFLDWAARETGREVAYASPAAEQRAREIVLRGSVSGLTPGQAITAVLATTPLQPRLTAERILVE